MRNAVKFILFAKTLPAPRFLAGDVGPPEWFRVLANPGPGAFRRNGYSKEIGLLHGAVYVLQNGSQITMRSFSDAATSGVPSCGRRQDFPLRIACKIPPPCIHTLCEIPLYFRTDVLSRVCHPHGPEMRRLAWVRAAPFQACSNRGSIKVPEILYDPPPLLVIFKFARVQWQWEFSIIGPPPPPSPFRKYQTFFVNPASLLPSSPLRSFDGLAGMNSVSVDCRI